MIASVRTILLMTVLVGFVAFGPSAHACAACFGASDSDMAKGMNMGIFALLGVIVAVLGSIASFFIFLARRTAAASIQAQPDLTKQTS